MRNVTPYSFIVGSTTPASSLEVSLVGRKFLNLRNLYLSGSNIGMFDNLTYFSPFSGISSMSNIYPPFSAILIPEFIVESDKNITFTFPQKPKTEGFIEIIAENEAGYGKLTTDSRYPFISSYQGAIDIQNPWVDGIIINNNPLDTLDRRIYIQILSETLKYYVFDTNIRTLANQYQLQTINIYDQVIENPTWLSTDTNIGTVDSTGLVSYVSGGYTTISALKFDNSNTRYLQMSSISSTFINNIISSANINTFYEILDYGTVSNILTESYVVITTENSVDLLNINPSYVGNINNYRTYTDLVGVSSNRVNFTYSGLLTSTDQLHYQSIGNGVGNIIANFEANSITYTISVSNIYVTTPYIYLGMINLPNTETTYISSYNDKANVIKTFSKTWELSAYDITNMSQTSSLSYIKTGPIQKIDNTITSLSGGSFTIYLSALSSQYVTGTAITSSVVLSSGFVQGSLAWTFNNEIEERLAGKTPSPFVNLNIINPQMSYYTSNTYTMRNSACWMADVDMSFYSTAKNNTTDNSFSRAILIAPDICLFARHYQQNTAYPVTITWRSSAGVGYTGYITSSSNTRSSDTNPVIYGDIVVARMTSAVNIDIKPVRFLPTDWNLYMTNVYGVEAVCGSQDHKYSPIYPNATFNGVSRTDGWQASGYTGHDGTLVGGDSSSPEGFILNDEFLIVGIASSIPFYVGGFYPNYISTINSMMSSLGSIHQCQYPSLTAFPTY